MHLMIENNRIEVQPEENILDLIHSLKLDSGDLASRPLAAKIAGEVFTLNYIPLRQKDADAQRHAIQASNGQIRLLHYNDDAGKAVYTRTACFLVFLSLRQLWPDCSAKISCTLGNSVYISVDNFEGFDLALLKQQIQMNVELDFPLIRRRITRQEAIDSFMAQNQPDKAALLKWQERDTFDIYSHQGYSDYFFGEMLPSTGYLTVWDVLPAENGFILLYPDDLNPGKPSEFRDMPNFFAVFNEGRRWGELMECETVADLNRLTESHQIRELIRVNEALHEKRFSQIADAICERNARIIMLAGPSSSGKTTSANRLATQLRVHGKKPVLMSLDNYYLDRSLVPREPDGSMDFEHIRTIDVPLFRQHIAQLLAGEEIEIPKYSFLTGCREWVGNTMRLSDRSVIIVEGIHGLNPALSPEGIEPNAIFRLYVSPLIPLNLDNHNRIATSYLRILRRIVRDYETRGTSVQGTIAMWDSVRRGEVRWIYPFQENADAILNSSTLYELAVLKRHIYPLLAEVKPEESCYDDVQNIVKILDYVQEADVDDEIPPTSLVREFIGGNKFYS